MVLKTINKGNWFSCPVNFTIIKTIIFLFIFLVTACKSNSNPQRANNAPEWTRDPYIRYNRNLYVAAIGMGSSHELAERSALANLIAIFGQSIEMDETIAESYEQLSRSGYITNWSEQINVDIAITRLASIDSLIGAEIGEIWHDTGRNDYYAAAVLNRARAAQIYTDLIRSNQLLIENVLDIPQEERNTLEGLSRYHLAALIADMLTPYNNLLSVIGAPVQGLKTGADYRLEAADIARTIPIALRVQNDRSGRIQGAFARALSDMGFQSGGTSSRYLLEVSIVIEPVILTGNPNSWTRIEVNADLLDTNLGTVLLPFNFNSREGHTSQSEADNRAYMAAERRINADYSRLLYDYLSQLPPGSSR